MPADDDVPSVAAVVLTRNRQASLRSTLDAIMAQSRPADEIIVVDNASDDDTLDMLHGEFTGVHVVSNGTNEGAAGGRARGMTEAFERGHDAVWFVDDDTTPDADTLARTLTIAEGIPNLGMLGQLGGIVRYGVIRHRQDRGAFFPGSAARRVDFVLTDGAIVTRAAYERAGVLDADYFIMMEDIEYPLRVARAGLVVAQADLGLAFQHLGALPSGASAPSAPWRLYYQTRNHLRMALDLRSPALVLGWMYRQVGALVALVRQPDRRRERLRYRCRGALDGLRNRMGPVVTPPR